MRAIEMIMAKGEAPKQRNFSLLSSAPRSLALFTIKRELTAAETLYRAHITQIKPNNGIIPKTISVAPALIMIDMDRLILEPLDHNNKELRFLASCLSIIRNSTPCPPAHFIPYTSIAGNASFGRILNQIQAILGSASGDLSFTMHPLVTDFKGIDKGQGIDKTLSSIISPAPAASLATSASPAPPVDFLASLISSLTADPGRAAHSSNASATTASTSTARNANRLSWLFKLINNSGVGIWRTLTLSRFQTAPRPAASTPSLGSNNAHRPSVGSRFFSIKSRIGAARRTTTDDASGGPMSLINSIISAIKANPNAKTAQIGWLPNLISYVFDPRLSADVRKASLDTLKELITVTDINPDFFKTYNLTIYADVMTPYNMAAWGQQLSSWASDSTLSTNVCTSALKALDSLVSHSPDNLRAFALSSGFFKIYDLATTSTDPALSSLAKGIIEKTTPLSSDIIKGISNNSTPVSSKAEQSSRVAYLLGVITDPTASGNHEFAFKSLGTLTARTPNPTQKRASPGKIPALLKIITGSAFSSTARIPNSTQERALPGKIPALLKIIADPAFSSKIQASAFNILENLLKKDSFNIPQFMKANGMMILSTFIANNSIADADTRKSFSAINAIKDIIFNNLPGASLKDPEMAPSTPFSSTHHGSDPSSTPSAKGS